MNRPPECTDRCYGDSCVHLAPAVDLSIVDYLRNNCDVDFEYVALGGERRAGDPPRYFLADYRDQSGYPEPWVCIHSWTASPASLLRNLRWTSPGKPRRLWVFEARNKGQIAAWLDDLGYTTRYSGPKFPAQPAQERVIVNSRERQIVASQNRIAAEQARIDRLMSLPQEPSTEDPDGALVVWFSHKFSQSGFNYTYAAVKASDGKWYTTGPSSPKGYTWDMLVEWHFTAVNQDNPMWVAGGWEPLA